MSEEIKGLKQEFNNYKARTDARLSSQDQQIKAFYTAMESIQVLAQSMAEVFSGGAPQPVSQEPVKTANVTTWPVLEPGKYVQSLTGTIVDDVVVREVQVQGKPTPIADFNLTDGVTVVKVSVWDALIKALDGFGKGDTITLTGLGIKEYKGVLQVSTTRKSTIG